MSSGLVLGFLAATTFLLTVAGFLALGRAIARRHRRLARERLAAMLVRWREFAQGAPGERDVRRLARATDPTTFWSALETLSLELKRGERRRLSDAIARVPHVKAERRALRDESPWRRELAARRLGLIHAFDSRSALRGALQQGPEPVAYAAAAALARQRDGRTLAWIFAHPSYFASRPPRQRTALLRAFGPAATPRIAAELAQGIADPGLERAAIERLGAAGHTASGPEIRRRLEHPSLELRVAAARALGWLGDTANVPALVTALGDRAWEVRAQAARALGRIGDPDAVSALADRLGDEQWWVRRHAAYALAELGLEGEAVLRLESKLSNDRYARDIAGEALAVGPARGPELRLVEGGGAAVAVADEDSDLPRAAAVAMPVEAPARARALPGDDDPLGATARPRRPRASKAAAPAKRKRSG